ncbi:MAG: FkbM family methyltransferase [Spirochaetaceae bacterium]|jgi:FkbM family methyltransferase|nr:FkbM family methyltransferase [Spirochaetaceae bacterium]
MFKLIKKIIKACLPYGLAVKLSKYRGNRKTQKDYFQFIPDPECRITGWMEPAHVKLELDPGDWIQKHIFYEGMYEKDAVQKLYELLPQDGVFFDLGANIGVYSLNLFRKAKTVFAFEATKTTYNTLNKTITDNHITNIRTFLNAVDDKDDAEVKIFYGDRALGKENNGSNSMHTGGGGIIANTVKTIRLDTFVEQTGLSRIDLIKIDIEGNELPALKGGTRSVMKYRPVLFCEINPELNLKAGYTAKELYAYIVKELRYSARKLSNGSFIPLSKTPESQQNIFFFPL